VKVLWITEQTVKFHLSNIYKKLGVANRTEAASSAAQLGRGMRGAEPVGAAPRRVRSSSGRTPGRAVAGRPK
jgi:hypothetical protein